MKKALLALALIVSVIVALILIAIVSVNIYDILYERSAERNSSILDVSKVDQSKIDEHGYYSGSYIKWRDNDSFTYKSYSGTLDIDSKEFYDVNVNEVNYKLNHSNYNSCNYSSAYYPRTYPELSNRKLKKIAKYDPLAAFDMLIRDIDISDQGKFYENLITAKHLTTTIERYPLNNVPKNDDLNKYFDIAPIAVFWQYMRDYYSIMDIKSKKERGEIDSNEADILIKEYDEKIIDLHRRLQSADNDWFMAIAVEKLFETTGEIDNDTLCEAYYRGCYFLYDMKVEHNIKCADVENN